MKTVIEDIILHQKITTVFQPIIDVTTHTILGYEALTRGPKGSIFEAPDKLFYHATKLGLLSDLEILCRDKAISTFASLALPGKLFINVSPMVLLDKNHPQGRTKRLIEQAGLRCQDVVIELSEKYPVPNVEVLHRALEKYQSMGFSVAIDDLGVGYSGLKQWSQLKPDIVKVDIYFITDCDTDPFKQKFLAAILDLATATDSKVIFEGIETLAEYQFLETLGMRYAQGYFLAMPSTCVNQDIDLLLDNIGRAAI